MALSFYQFICHK